MPKNCYARRLPRLLFRRLAPLRRRPRPLFLEQVSEALLDIGGVIAAAAAAATAALRGKPASALSCLERPDCPFELRDTEFHSAKMGLVESAQYSRSNGVLQCQCLPLSLLPTVTGRCPPPVHFIRNLIHARVPRGDHEENLIHARVPRGDHEEEYMCTPF